MEPRDNRQSRQLALVTGASSGIGFELARICASNNFDLVLAADESLDAAAETFRGLGAQVETVECDLATLTGVDTLVAAVGTRRVDALIANAGHGLGQAFLDELKDSGVTVTCLMPGATETRFFERAGMLDTKVGQDAKDDPADVARDGFSAMMRGDGDVVSGWKNKIQTTIANVTPSGVLAEQHRKMAEPGTGNEH